MPPRSGQGGVGPLPWGSGWDDDAGGGAGGVVESLSGLVDVRGGAQRDAEAVEEVGHQVGGLPGFEGVDGELVGAVEGVGITGQPCEGDAG